MEPPAAETNGVIEASASRAGTWSLWTANGANGDVLANARGPAAVVSRRSTVNAIIHPHRTVVVTVSVTESNIAAAVPGTVHQEPSTSGIRGIEIDLSRLAL